MPPEQSILTPEQEAKLNRYFDTLVKRAESAKPELKSYTSMDKFTQAERDYNNNPLRKDIKTAQDERAERLKSGDSKEAVDALYAQRIKEMRDRFISGERHGAPDPDAPRKQQGIFDALMSGNWMGAIKQFLLSFGPIGDMVAGGMRWIKSMVFGGEKLSLSQSIERMKIERSLGGAAMNLGMNSEEAQSFVTQGVQSYEGTDANIIVLKPDDHAKVNEIKNNPAKPTSGGGDTQVVSAPVKNQPAPAADAPAPSHG